MLACVCHGPAGRVRLRCRRTLAEKAYGGIRRGGVFQERYGAFSKIQVGSVRVVR